MTDQSQVPIETWQTKGLDPLDHQQGAEYSSQLMGLLCQVSSVELERVVIAAVPAVMEAAAVGVTPPGGGPEQLAMFLVLHKTHQKHPPSPHTAEAAQAESMMPHASQEAQVTPALASQTQQAGSNQQEVKAGATVQTSVLSLQTGRAGQTEQASDVGAGHGLEGLWDALGRAKAAASKVADLAASKVADLTAAAVPGAAFDAHGQDAVSDAQAGSGDGELQQVKLLCQRAIRNSLNPLFKLERVLLRESLPRTASNKVMRRLLRDELQQASAKL